MKTFTLILLATFTLAFAAAAQTLSLNPIADTFVSASNPNSNYGAAGALEVSATGSAKGIFYSLLQFNLSGASGLTIQSISLQLVTANPANALFNANTAGLFSVIWMDNSSWTEGSGTPMSPGGTGLTYNTLPGYLDSSDETLGTFTSSAVTSATNTYSLSLPAGFLNAVTSGSDISLEIVPEDTTMSYLTNSENFTTAASRPVLTVVAVPEPARLVLLGIGLLALAGWRRYGLRTT